jgi:hypothetical protein
LTELPHLPKCVEPNWLERLEEEGGFALKVAKLWQVLAFSSVNFQE